MNKLRNSLVVFCLLIIIAQLLTTNFENLSWDENTGNYLGIFSMICIIIAMLLSNKHDKKTTNKRL
ncbi:MAG: hypothetical protein MI739_07190 [Bacteroidales bacterium]|nr:hypothetical protein [Bacteroidales bacterium]